MRPTPTEEGRAGETTDEGPLRCVVGDDELPPRVSAALEGREVGDAFELALDPDDAFGAYDPAGIVSVPREDLPADELEVGDWIAVTIEDEDAGTEEELEMRVMEIHPDAVVLDANHPLADQRVTFEIRVIDVSD